MTMHIRLASLADLDAIREIYNYYVERSTCTFQMETETEDARLAWFQNRTAAHPATVVELDGQVVGWGSLSPWNARAGYARTVEASIYLRHDVLGHGIGKALLVDLVDRARKAGHHTVIGGACTEQTASLALMKSLGFAQTACFQQVGYKFDRWLDVAYLQLFLQAKSEAPAT